MSLPSMVHRSGDALIVRSVDASDSPEDSDQPPSPPATPPTPEKDLPDCKVKRNYSCTSCDFFTQNPRHHLHHLRDVHNEKVKIYECPSCIYASKHFQKLLRHIKMVHGDSDKPKVKVEEVTSGDEDSPVEDKERSSFKCSVCSFVSKNQQVLSKHEREEHIRTKFYRCAKCTYVTHIKARYTKHVKYHSMPMIKCDMCDFRTPYKWNLDRHCKNHNGHGAFKCSACNFTADIKQSLTVHEMNHHVPPVGQAAGLGVGRRRNKVGASDATAAEEAATLGQAPPQPPPEDDRPKAKKLKQEGFTSSDFIHPDDIIQRANGNVYIKIKCKYCSFKTAWSVEMAKHERKAHGIEEEKKKLPRPVPNLIPIPLQKKKEVEVIDSEPEMSQKDINDICAKSGNSALKDLASLFGSEDVFKDSSPKMPELIPAFPKKNASFFDQLQEKLLETTNLVCANCGFEAKCLTEQAKHAKNCGQEQKIQTIPLVHNVSSSRCQYCRQRCKTSADLLNHLQTCPDYINYFIKDDSIKVEEPFKEEEEEAKPHPMENKVFVWNDIPTPMDLVEDYQEETVDDGSIDLSIRTQSPVSESNSVVYQSSPVSTEKVPTHGNDISVAQHKRVFKCPHCTFWASTASRFHVHIVGHLNKKPFECSLCAYRSNWRWDITKHIKLKSVRDQAHESAKVLMTDETGRRNYTKYNKYLTEIPVSGEQSMDTSGGSGTRPKHYQERSGVGGSPGTSKDKGAKEFSPLRGALRPPPGLKAADAFLKVGGEKKRSLDNNKKTFFKCKKCNFRNASRNVLLEHVKGHYQGVAGGGEADALQDLSLRGTSPDRDEASVINGAASRGQAPFRCGHCNQVSNWKHVIQRHCRLKHSGDIRVVSNKNGQEKLEVEEQPEEPDHVDVPQDGAFKCPECPFSSDSIAELNLHQVNHSQISENSLKCHFCRYFVEEKEGLWEHLKLHGVQDPEDFLTRVTNQDSDPKKFKCVTCPYVTNSKSQYTYHKQFHRPRGWQYTCPHCTYNVSKRHLLHQHLKVHGINIAPHKQNGEVIDVDVDDEIEEIATPSTSYEHLHEIPLVWVSKNSKFSKMFKCRFCPHVNLRKVNIQEHEKMHTIREKNPNSRPNEVEHRCGECNYVCNNAGVLSSHSKVHQGLYGVVHRLVDPSKTDEEQIREMSKMEQEEDFTADIEESEGSNSGSSLWFCKECPARFLKENEFSIHRRLHSVRLNFKCDYCSYSAKQSSHLSAHAQVHTSEYQDRTRVLLNTYPSSPNRQPFITTVPNGSGGLAYVVQEDDILTRPLKNFNVPISGTELFQQKSEALRNALIEPQVQKSDPQFGMMMHGNPEFIYPTYLKNGRMKEKRYKCPKCPSAFDKREQYKVHLGLHGANQKYSCDYCDYSVKYYANYVQHLKKHKLNDDAHASREEGFGCQYCPFVGSDGDELSEHLVKHGGASQLCCEHCDFAADSEEELGGHVKLHFSPAVKLDGYMDCDNLKLTASDVSDDSHLVFEEGERGFLPELEVEGFNNNDGEEEAKGLKESASVSRMEVN